MVLTSSEEEDWAGLEDALAPLLSASAAAARQLLPLVHQWPRFPLLPALLVTWRELRHMGRQGKLKMPLGEQTDMAQPAALHSTPGRAGT